MEKMEVRRSPRKKSPSPVVGVCSTSADSESPSEDGRDADFTPHHGRPGSSTGSSRGSGRSPQRKRRRKERPAEETLRSGSEDGSRSEPQGPCIVQRGKRRQRCLRPGDKKSRRWRTGLSDGAVRDYDEAMVEGFLQKVSDWQQKNFRKEWDSDDIISDDDDSDHSPLSERGEDLPAVRIVPNTTFINRLEREK